MKTLAVGLTLGLGVAGSGAVEAENTGPTLDEWQLDLIYHPSDAMLEREARGFVFIYDGFTDTQVEQVLDDQYDRIESMMFTRVKKTDENGERMIDPETGDEMLFDDGCD